MKIFMATLAFALVFVGCGDSEEPVASEQEQEVTSEVVEEVSEPDDLVVDSDSDVSILDVEQQESDVAVESGPEVSEEESEQLDEDPTSFRNNPNPGSHFFNPEVP